MKRWLVALLVVSMMLSLAGCGGSGSRADQSKNANTNATWVPVRDIEFIIPFAAGGGNDIMVRKLIEIIQKNKMIPVNIVPISKPGGSGVVGYTYLSSKGKGYEYALASTSASFYTQPLTGNSPFTPDEKSFSFVSHLAKDPVAFVSISSTGFKSLQDVVDYAKKNPGKLKFAGTGIMSDDAIICALLNKTFGIEIVYVPYNAAGEMLQSLLGGHVQLATLAPAEALEHMKAGSLTPHAVSSDSRLSQLPNVPTFKELGYDINQQQSRAIVMASGVDPKVQAYYSDLFKRVSETPEWKEFLKSGNMGDAYMDHKAFAAYAVTMKEKYATYLKMIKEAQK